MDDIVIAESDYVTTDEDFTDTDDDVTTDEDFTDTDTDTDNENYINFLKEQEYLEYLENRMTLDDEFPNCPVYLELESNNLYEPITFNWSIDIVSECQCHETIFNKKIERKEYEPYISEYDIVQVIMENSEWFNTRHNTCKHSSLFKIKSLDNNVFQLQFSIQLPPDTGGS
jgi:hypothetical protein